jgi:NAD(P)-dependent dehydrogenase (short-subunit alcohol dehydrogenase family)
MNVTKTNNVQGQANSRLPLLTDKVVIVTGASSGIGSVTAWECARRGAQVVLAARREHELSTRVQVMNAEGYRAVAIPTDVTDREQVERLVQQTVETFGRIDVLVNNAGIALRDTFTQNSPEEIEKILAVNLRGALLLTRAVIPGMLQRHRGTIISVASVAAHIPVDPLYSATKYGIRGFSLSLYRQLQGTGVTSCIVSPGFVRTPLNRHMRMPMPGPEIVARAIANLAVKPRREVIVPGYYHGLIAFEHLFPWLTDFFVRVGRKGIGA